MGRRRPPCPAPPRRHGSAGRPAGCGACRVLGRLPRGGQRGGQQQAGEERAEGSISAAGLTGGGRCGRRHGCCCCYRAAPGLSSLPGACCQRCPGDAVLQLPCVQAAASTVCDRGGWRRWACGQPLWGLGSASGFFPGASAPPLGLPSLPQHLFCCPAIHVRPDKHNGTLQEPLRWVCGCWADPLAAYTRRPPSQSDTPPRLPPAAPRPAPRPASRPQSQGFQTQARQAPPQSPPPMPHHGEAGGASRGRARVQGARGDATTAAAAATAPPRWLPAPGPSHTGGLEPARQQLNSPLPHPPACLQLPRRRPCRSRAAA